MIPRSTIIAALLVIEVAILGEALVAVRAGQAAPSPGRGVVAQAAAGSRLVEGGPHQIFDAAAHPALTVDIGDADLTILTSKAAQIDVSVSASNAFGVFRATAPIAAREDGGTIRIAAGREHRWSMGDDRMVTVVVPAETRVTVVEAGDIKANGLRAEASFNSVGSGSVTVEDYDAPALHVAASNGRISLHEIVAARFDAASSNGRVEGTALQVHDGSVESDGPVTLGFATGADTLVTAEAKNGRVSVTGLPAAASAGTAHRDGDDDEDSSSQTVRFGAGTGHLDVHASDGNISLAQEG